jgi:hypothetical protein
MASRPKEVARFEMLFLAAIMVGVAAAALDWQALAVDSIGMLATISSLVITLGLVLATSRYASNIARWVLAVLTLVNVPLSLMMTDFSSSLGFVTVVTNLLQLAALVLIFSRPARIWFAARPAAASSSQGEEAAG